MYILTSVLLLTLRDVSVDPLLTGKACPLCPFSTELGVSCALLSQLFCSWPMARTWWPKAGHRVSPWSVNETHSDQSTLANKPTALKTVFQLHKLTLELLRLLKATTIKHWGQGLGPSDCLAWIWPVWGPLHSSQYDFLLIIKALVILSVLGLSRKPRIWGMHFL